MTVTNQLSCQVGKTDAFGLDVSAWANGDSLTSYNVTSVNGLIDVKSVAVDGYKITFLATGIEAGVANALIEWETQDRSRKENMLIRVV